MLKQFDMQGKPFEVSLLNLEENKIVLIFEVKGRKGGTTVIYLNTNQVIIQGFNHSEPTANANYECRGGGLSDMDVISGRLLGKTSGSRV